MVFVEGKIVKSRRTQKSSSEAPDAGTKVSWKRLDTESSSSTSPGPEISVQDVVPRLNEYEVYICYMRRHLFPNGPIDQELQKLHVSDLDHARTSTKIEDNSLFIRAALTFGTLLFGSRHRQTPILVEGYSMQGATLKQLNQALSIPGCHHRDDIIHIIILMAILEMYLPSGPRNWLKHMLGLEKLLGLRDPSLLTYAPPQTLELYKGVRHMVLIAALRNRSPSIFARPSWKAVLRTALSLETVEERELHSVLADCSVLNAASDEVARTLDLYGPVCIERVDSVRKNAVELLVFLHSWKERWDHDERNAFTVEDDPEAVTAGAPQAFHTVYRFQDDSVTRMFMLYTTALIGVLEIIEAIEKLQQGLPCDGQQGTYTNMQVGGTAASTLR